MKKFIQVLKITCSDGWESPSTGQGTCSHHGGIGALPSDSMGFLIFVIILIVILLIAGIILYINKSSKQNAKEKEKNNTSSNSNKNKLNKEKNNHGHEKATEEQKWFMNKKNIKFEKNISKKEAEEKINNYLEENF